MNKIVQNKSLRVAWKLQSRKIPLFVSLEDPNPAGFPPSCRLKTLIPQDSSLRVTWIR